MKRIIRRYDPTFNSIIELIEKESKQSKWSNSEGMRVIAKYTYGIKISKLNGSWSRITVLDEKKYSWLLLKI